MKRLKLENEISRNMKQIAERLKKKPDLDERVKKAEAIKQQLLFTTNSYTEKLDKLKQGFQSTRDEFMNCIRNLKRHEYYLDDQDLDELIKERDELNNFLQALQIAQNKC